MRYTQFTSHLMDVKTEIHANYLRSNRIEVEMKILDNLETKIPKHFYI